ncbi:putative transposase [Escherichia coli]|uniref:Putative transposase n=1 Tax=Escherichia coli TaxID=562 RepID=A0A377F494_ECOLX|nr:putative transposase [Escherichia coli]
MCVSRLHGFKSQRGADYPFQFAMIAFNHVVPVLNLSVFNVRRHRPSRLSKQARDHSGRFIRVDESRICHFFTLLGFYQKPVCSFAVTTEENKNRQCGPGCRRPGTDTPSGHDLHVGFIHVPRQRSEGLRQYQRSRFPFQAHNANPAVNRGVIDIHSAFSQHLLQLTLTDAYCRPAYAHRMMSRLKMPAFEWFNVQLHQQKG